MDASVKDGGNTTEERSSVPFDHHLPGDKDPYGAWGELRRETPVAWSQAATPSPSARPPAM